jgi:hypothetical protein
MKTWRLLPISENINLEENKKLDHVPYSMKRWYRKANYPSFSLTVQERFLIMHDIICRDVYKEFFP